MRALDALLSRRRQLLEMRVMESNRLGSCADPTVRAGLERHLAWLKAEVADADRLLAEAVKASPAWREKDELLRSIPGLGPVLQPDAAGGPAGAGRRSTGASWRPWSGLAPFADDSGHAPRRAARPRAAGRRCAGCCTWRRCRRCGTTRPLKAFRDRLAARGKKAKVILTAVARKLLVIANAVIRTGRPWDPELAMAR